MKEIITTKNRSKKIITTFKDRQLQSGRIVPQLNQEINMTIASMCPEKWLFVDLEKGYVWHIREDQFNQKKSSNFWRSANKKELNELKKLKT